MTYATGSSGNMSLLECVNLNIMIKYIYVPIQCNYVFSMFHCYCNYKYCLNGLLLSAALQRNEFVGLRTVQCFVLFILLSVQHKVDDNNFVEPNTGLQILFNCRWKLFGSFD